MTANSLYDELERTGTRPLFDEVNNHILAKKNVYIIENTAGYISYGIELNGQHFDFYPIWFCVKRRKVVFSYYANRNTNSKVRIPLTKEHIDTIKKVANQQITKAKSRVRERIKRRVRQAELVKKRNARKQKEIEQAKQDIEDMHARGDMYLNELNLTPRAYQCLRRVGIKSVNHLKAFLQESYAEFGTPQKLLKIRNLGQKRADEILSALQRLNG